MVTMATRPLPQCLVLLCLFVLVTSSAYHNRSAAVDTDVVLDVDHGSGDVPYDVQHGPAERVDTHSTLEEAPSTGHLDTHGGQNKSAHHGIHVASLNFQAVQHPFIMTVIILVAALCKIGFHHADFLSSIVPESCFLILFGVVIGAILFFSKVAEELPEFLTPHEFFHYLLPPIILEASFSLHDITFYNNLGSILIFAVIGTVIATFSIGFTLYGLAVSGAMGAINITATETLLFSSLIVAVDPVAVLAVFQEIGVNNVLYFIVFGESLLNDGVTVVIYQVMQEFNVMPYVEGLQVVLGILRFFVVASCGVLIGVSVGCVSAIVTKYTNHVKVAEPMAVFGFAYLSFLLAEVFEFSGIISIIACGMTQVQYTFNNITPKSRTTVKYFTKVISTTNEILIFIFLGLALVNDNHVWHTGFVLWTIFWCLVYRLLATYFLSFLINRFDEYRVRKISLDEQFIISYGGLRGAVCFSLVAMLDGDIIPQKNMFVTTTLAVIIFTVFIQGITIKPLVKLLRIKLQTKTDPTLFEELSSQVMDHMMAGVEDVVGFHGKFYLKEVMDYYDDHYFKHWLLRRPFSDSDEEICKIFQKLALEEHYKNLYLCNARNVPIGDQMRKALSTDLLNNIGVTDRESQPLDSDALTVSFDMDERPRSIIKMEGDTPSAKDLRKIIFKHRAALLLHMGYNKNIVNENQSDFGVQLREKRLRTQSLLRMKSTPGLEGIIRQQSWAHDPRDEQVKPIVRRALTMDETQLLRAVRSPPETISMEKIWEEEIQSSDDEMSRPVKSVRMRRGKTSSSIGKTASSIGETAHPDESRHLLERQDATVAMEDETVKETIM